MKNILIVKTLAMLLILSSPLTFADNTELNEFQKALEISPEKAAHFLRKKNYQLRENEKTLQILKTRQPITKTLDDLKAISDRLEAISIILLKRKGLDQKDFKFILTEIPTMDVHSIQQEFQPYAEIMESLSEGKVLLSLTNKEINGFLKSNDTFCELLLDDGNGPAEVAEKEAQKDDEEQILNDADKLMCYDIETGAKI